MIMQANLSGIQAFCLAYELGNFTEAAKALDVSPQAVSRAVARLEADLGVTLFRRSTRHIHATEQGRLYYTSARDALQALLEAERKLLAEEEDRIEGCVRVLLPTAYAHRRFLPWLARFQNHFPGIDVELTISNRQLDFVAEGFDLAIRAGDVKRSSSYTIRKLGDFSLGVFASPAYLAEQGTPTFPMELEQHRCLLFTRPHSNKVLPWTFSPDPDVFIPPSSIRVSQDELGLVTLAKQGAGFVQLPHFLVRDELERGELVEVLRSHGGRARTFSLLCHAERLEDLAVQKLVEFVMERSLQDPRQS